jgi:hypothetical protein
VPCGCILSSEGNIMMRNVAFRAGFIVCAVCVSIWQAAPVWAHGFAGQRFFPEPIVMEDPFAADEVNLPSFSYIRGNDARELSFGVELQKRITPTVGLSVGGEYVMTNPLDSAEKNSGGYTNPEFAVKWTPYINGPHETVVGLQFSLGSTLGNHNVSEDEHSTLGTQISFGRGLGDLPESVGWLRPVAFEGAAQIESPIGAETDVEGSVLHYNFVVQYSLIYLQSFVKDMGIPWPFSRLFPEVEFGFDTPLAGDTKGRTDGFVYPGFVWAGKYIELGLEAQVPLIHNTGDNVGVVGLVHLFTDDIWPNVFRPIFGVAPPKPAVGS